MNCWIATINYPLGHSELVEESPQVSTLFKRPLDALGVTYNMTLRRIIFCPTINSGLYSLFIVILSASEESPRVSALFV